MTEKIRKELEVIFRNPLLDWVNEKSIKQMTEVCRDVFPNATKKQICDLLGKYWEKDDSPGDLFAKLQFVEL